jgi:hypothetical protein
MSNNKTKREIRLEPLKQVMKYLRTDCKPYLAEEVSPTDEHEERRIVHASIHWTNVGISETAAWG